MIDSRIEEAAAARIIRAQFPDLGARQVRYLGEGCDSVAVDVGGRWVFKFPKRADVAAELRREMRVLPILANSAPLAIPDFRFTGEPSADFPFHFGGYAKIPGAPAIGLSTDGTPLAAWVPAVAAFLTWLHTRPVDEAAALGVERQTTAALIDELQADAPEAIVHRDFAAEHVLVDPVTRAITGVIDWTEIAIANPAIDMAGLYHWGGAPFVDAVLEHYRGPIDRASLTIARYLGACRGAADVAFGDRMRRPEYIAAGLRSLEANAGRGR